MTTCNCDMWEDGIDEVNRFIAFGATRWYISKFDKKYQFKYCPWCGKKLVVENT